MPTVFQLFNKIDEEWGLYDIIRMRWEGRGKDADVQY
jgi:hypothetical protein